MNPAREKQKRKPPAQNPIEAAITTWLSLSPQTDLEPGELIAQAPKRWTAYEPMVLLPTGAFTISGWQAVLNSSGDQRANELWKTILSEISKRSKTELTHLAVNEGIPLHNEHSESKQQTTTSNTPGDNILRSPSGLRILYGDFGPSEVLSADHDGAGAGARAAETDFQRAFWVHTKQNGIFQAWAPRWTMFSRGNIKEKARLLDFHHADGGAISGGNEERLLQHRKKPPAELKNAVAVDLYAGIGYFVFSYARLGMRVLCWELNPWSVEGLRRGANGNGWSVKVVQGADLRLRMEDLLAGGEQIVVFLEDNTRAAGRIRELRALDGVMHVNCGLLPTSYASWRDAWEIAGRSEESWLHLHENVGVADIATRKGEIEQWFLELSRGERNTKAACVEHVELVKTFAPGVWHCVFDLYITRSSSIT
ncbi:Uu.00g076570.m01.CDS01 [Anthostomella pinea]|uniref:tRNA wybutosine-synthesizing protein 2 n=1 Tax=Anthostomella pinea TaxID=933095 RepID=A0AAI8YLV0_9PEZI|nr:Uu.00g076570.m01.CDS01 [Anthostomella pinea]